jgi:hypothetical protein
MTKVPCILFAWFRCDNILKAREFLWKSRSQFSVVDFAKPLQAGISPAWSASTAVRAKTSLSNLETGTDTAGLGWVFTNHALPVFDFTWAIPPVGKGHAVDIADHSVRLAIAQAQVAIDIDRDALPRGGAVATSLGTVGELLAAQQQVIHMHQGFAEAYQNNPEFGLRTTCTGGNLGM